MTSREPPRDAVGGKPHRADYDVLMTNAPGNTPLNDDQIRTRACLAALPAYVAGHAAPDPEAFKISSNESPFGPIPSVRQAMIAALDGVNRYPDMISHDLRRELGSQHGVSPEQVVVSTGSVVVTSLVIQALCEPGDEVVYPWRSFEAYPILVGGHGAVSVQVPLTDGHGLDLDAMAAAVTDRTRAVIVCSPNNPTGTAVTDDALRAFLARVPDDVLVVLDEAYLQFADPGAQFDGMRAFHSHSNVVLLRTFSKIHGLAGARVGYALAHPRLASALHKVNPPFSTNSLAQAGALASLSDEAMGAVAERSEMIRAERERVLGALYDLGWDVPDSQGNFVYFPVGERSAEFTEFCAERGLIVRRYGDEGVRATIDVTEANDRLIATATEWFRTRRSR